MRDEDEKAPNSRFVTFNTTQWSVVLRAGDGDSPEQMSSLEALCQEYWSPVYSFIRRGGRSSEDAKDLTQGFFAHLIKNQISARADPNRGRFRTFLLASLKQFLSRTNLMETRQKRGGDKEHVSIDFELAEERYTRELIEPSTPDEGFDRDWATLELDSATDKLREEYRRAGQLERFEALCANFMKADNALPYEEIGARLGIAREGVRSAARQLRARFRRLFREQLARLVDDPAEVDDEIRHLIAALGSGGGA